jgi:hypothetical protein
LKPEGITRNVKMAVLFYQHAAQSSPEAAFEYGHLNSSDTQSEKRRYPRRLQMQNEQKSGNRPILLERRERCGQKDLARNARKIGQIDFDRAPADED